MQFIRNALTQNLLDGIDMNGPVHDLLSKKTNNFLLMSGPVMFYIIIALFHNSVAPLMKASRDLERPFSCVSP